MLRETREDAGNRGALFIPNMGLDMTHPRAVLRDVGLFASLSDSALNDIGVELTSAILDTARATATEGEDDDDF